MYRIFFGALCLVSMVEVTAPAAEPFDYFSNSWALVGLKDYEDATRLTPQNELLLGEKQRLRIYFGSHSAPLSRRQTKMRMDGWLPIILWSAEQDGVRYNFRCWATPLPNVKDWRTAFEQPAQGENYLNWIWVQITNSAADSRVAQLKAERIGKTTVPLEAFSQSLAPGAGAEVIWRVPYSSVEQSFTAESPQIWLNRTVEYWRGLLAQGAVLETPEDKVNDAWRASHVDQFINNDHGEVQGGEGFYDIFYIRDGAYEVQQFEEAGFLEAARAALPAYLKSQRPDGRFETQAGQFDANGQAVWTLWQYYLIAGDKSWLEEVYPAMRKAVAWTEKARREAPADSPFAGLLPNALADGEYLWNGKYHIVGYDFWNLRGMLCTAEAAHELGKQAEFDQLMAEAQSYRQAIDAAWKRTGLPHFPPSWEKAGTHWGDTETLWPTPLFAIDDPRIGASIQEVRERFGGGFCEGTIRWSPDSPRSAIHPYMSSYTTMNSLIRGEHEQVVEDFYWYLLHSTATQAFPEGIFYEQRFAWSDTIPHATGAANYCFLLRHMLLHEQGEELHLLPAIPDWWLDSGQQIRVLRAPTHFGPVSFTIVGGPEGLEMTYEAPQRKRPSQVVLHLPKSRTVKSLPAGIKLASREGQSRRWDFTAVCEEYEKIKPQEISGLLPFPLEISPDATKCQPLDLSSLANTDPFNAPFGVLRPGKFLFTEMPVGRINAAGVPFNILDPVKNDGCGLVVLRGSRAGDKAATFPVEVSIPLGRTGTRLYFLGNVVGWSGGDAGAGPHGAVAEYIIHYADGQQQSIPWVLGKTADDWAGNPGAVQTFVGLQGEPWHLNVLGVELRKVPVKEIVFRDLGTVSAPLLAAVTIEE